MRAQKALLLLGKAARRAALQKLILPQCNLSCDHRGGTAGLIWFKFYSSTTSELIAVSENTHVHWLQWNSVHVFTPLSNCSTAFHWGTLFWLEGHVQIYCIIQLFPAQTTQPPCRVWINLQIKFTSWMTHRSVLSSAVVFNYLFMMFSPFSWQKKDLRAIMVFMEVLTN